MNIWMVLFWIALAAGLAAGGWCLWLLANRRSLCAERDRLTGELADAERQVDSLRNEKGELERQITAAKTQLEGLDDKFRRLASDVLRQSNEQFLQLAKQAFEGGRKEAAAELEQRKQAIESMLKPIRETLDKHSTAVTQIEKQREVAYHGLKQQLASLLDAQQQLGRQTATLTNALQGSATARGRWGELTLKRIAELAGMIPHCDFSEQITVWRGDDAQRPDMVVRLPSDRCVVVDAKSVGQNYYAAIEATDETTRAQRFRDHLRDIESRVRDLSSKGYTERFERSPDFVVLFIPGESFLQPAVQLKPDLQESAMSRGVVIATPTILISLLRVIELGWREQRLAENARRVRDLGVELHERIATLTGHAEKVGSHLGNAVKSYNDFVGSLETRVLVSARRFKDLGADSSKELPAEGNVPTIDATPRQISAST